MVNGNTLMELNETTSVIAALNKQGGVYMVGTYLRVFNPAKNHPMIFETAIICATVGIMCPAMSLIASFLYYPYYMEFNIFTLLANWLK